VYVSFKPKWLSSEYKWLWLWLSIFCFAIFSSPGQVSFSHHLVFVVRCTLSHLNPLLWNHLAKLNQTWLGWFPFILCLTVPSIQELLLFLKIEISLIIHCCYKSNWAQILSVDTWQRVWHIFQLFLWNFAFSRFIRIMQIRHILIKD